MRANIIFIILLVVSGLLASTAFFFFPEIRAQGIAPAVAIAFGSSVTQLLAAGFFLSSPKAFKKELRPAYYWLAAGVFLFSLTQVIPSLSVFTDILSRSTAVAAIFIVTPYASGTLCMFIGMRIFAAVLGVRPKWGSFWIALGVAAIAAAAIFLAPHKAADMLYVDRWLYYVTFASAIWCATYGMVAALLALHVRKIVGPLYKAPMAWTAAALGMIALTALHETIVKIFFITSGYVANQYSLLPFLFAGILSLRAGVAFYNTRNRSVEMPPNPSYVDIVTSVARLVSKPADIDAKLDTVRKITSTGQALTSADQDTLRDVYVYVEDYLLTKESLRTFTKEGLRAQLPDAFLQDLKTHGRG